MVDTEYQWEMTNIQFGFTVFEKCAQTGDVRTYFSLEETWDEYVEGDRHWAVVENAQSFTFDLRCAKTGRIEKFDELMGLMYCTGCIEDCDVERLRQELAKQKTWMLLAFGFLPHALTNPISQHKLDILSDHFNQRRDTSRSKVKIVPFNLIKDISLCKGEFIHDVGLLSLEEPGERKPLL